MRVSVCVMIESQRGLDIARRARGAAGVDYLSFGMLDLAQSLGHPGNPAHPDGQGRGGRCIERIHAAGKRVREDFMNFVWINDVLMAGARHCSTRRAGSAPRDRRGVAWHSEGEQ